MTVGSWRHGQQVAAPTRALPHAMGPVGAAAAPTSMSHSALTPSLVHVTSIGEGLCITAGQ